MLQDGTHDLKTLGSGGMRLGPVSLVRAVGRVIRSVVGGDSDDSHQHQVRLPPELDAQNLAAVLAVLPPPQKAFHRISGECMAWLLCSRAEGNRRFVKELLESRQDLAMRLHAKPLLLIGRFLGLVMNPPSLLRWQPL